MGKSILGKRGVLLALSVMLVGVLGASATATGSAKGVRASVAPTTSYGPFSPTFVGPAATGCASDCSLLTGPFTTASTASLCDEQSGGPEGRSRIARPARDARPVNPEPRAASLRAAAPAAPAPVIPTVRCQPLGAGCDSISTSAGGATGVKGLNAVDSASQATNPVGDIEPPDQGLCAGNGSVVETNNIGEILVYNTALQRQSAPIPLDTIMGLTSRGWSSGGDPSCEYDSSNGGHWFFTEIASASPESGGGAFTGCFAAAANSCYEGIAVSKGNSPFGPYNVYFVNANYNPAEPGFPPCSTTSRRSG